MILSKQIHPKCPKPSPWKTSRWIAQTRFKIIVLSSSRTPARSYSSRQQCIMPLSHIYIYTYNRSGPLNNSPNTRQLDFSGKAALSWNRIFGSFHRRSFQERVNAAAMFTASIYTSTMIQLLHVAVLFAVKDVWNCRGWRRGDIRITVREDDAMPLTLGRTEVWHCMDSRETRGGYI